MPRCISAWPCWPAGRSTGAGWQARCWLYISGVSIYSVALVFYPARSGRLWLAALVYAVAGWAGSGLGIGLAEGRTDVPHWLLLGAAGVLLVFGLPVNVIIRRRAEAGENDKAAPR
jgi:zinc transporter ZupT